MVTLPLRLKHFGFSTLFCDWIDVILHSAKLSILVNGNYVGYFSCSRGVRQGGPLSASFLPRRGSVKSHSLDGTSF